MPENDARDRILRAAQELLQEGLPPEDVTVRAIAQRAGVSIGTVSYHYRSKDGLLSDAVGDLMARIAGGLQMGESGSARERLTAFLSDIAEIGLQYYSLCRISLNYEMTQGDMSICYYITPLLKEIYGGSKSDLQIKLAALGLITTLQSIFLRKEAFQRYAGVNIDNAKQRREALDEILELYLDGEGRE